MYICTCICMYTPFSTVLTYQIHGKKRKFPLRRHYASMVIKGSLISKMDDEIKKNILYARILLKL